MPCFHPLKAWRSYRGTISLGKEIKDSLPLDLPCGGCLGCRAAKAKAWALRCHLELKDHDQAAFTTLTYADEKLPATLSKRHLQLFFKRLRKAKHRQEPATTVRFFGCGEYGEQTKRPHYHAVIFGTGVDDRDLIEQAWGLGHTRTEAVNPARIAYVAGYTSLKIGELRQKAEERIDPETGELYNWQPPFIQMSRRPGIGASAREYQHSWRLFAIHNGTKQAVPRYLHEAWKATATDDDKEQLLIEKSKLRTIITDYHLKSMEQIAIKNQELVAQKRRFAR